MNDRPYSLLFAGIVEKLQVVNVVLPGGFDHTVAVAVCSLGAVLLPPLSNPFKLAVRLLIEGKKFDEDANLDRCFRILVFLWLFDMFANETANWLAADANESEAKGVLAFEIDDWPFDANLVVELDEVCTD